MGYDMHEIKASMASVIPFSLVYRLVGPRACPVRYHAMRIIQEKRQKKKEKQGAH